MMSEAYKLAEYGIAIFTVGLCVTIIWLLFNNFLKHAEKQNESFSRSVSGIADRHERERRDWLASEERRADQAHEILTELRDVIRESMRKD